jgi:hypothetical protein
MTKQRTSALTALRVLLVGFISVMAIGTAPAIAQDDGTPPETEFSIGPSAPVGAQPRSWFIYEMQPGQIFQDSIDVENFTDQEITLALYSTDACSLPGSGAFAGLDVPAKERPYPSSSRFRSMQNPVTTRQ